MIYRNFRHQPMATQARPLRRAFALLALASVCVVVASSADPPPYGIATRVPIGAYLDSMLPSTDNMMTPMPALISQTGAFTNTPARTPHPGLVEYGVNSALWTDAAIKQRYIALPTSGPQIGFTATDFWNFPNGTVFVKNFDLMIDERPGFQTVRRLETRILVRLANGGIRGASYRWRPDNQDADIVDDMMSGQTEVINVRQADGSTRTQTWLYPNPMQCLRCHNANAGLVLAANTAQLNGDYGYASGVTDNQLRTWNHLGMFNAGPGDSLSYPGLQKMVDVGDTNATLEHRARSYLASNCSFCHRPGSEGAQFAPYDMRFETPILSTNIISNAGAGGLVRDDLPASRLYVRDGSTTSPMPPIARNVPDARILAVYDQWVNSPFDVISAAALAPTQVQLRFSRALEPAGAIVPANYAVSGASVSAAVLEGDSLGVILTVSTLAAGSTYNVTINGVKENNNGLAPQNPIWPNTTISLTTPATVPDAPLLTGAGTASGRVTLTITPPGIDGGSPITRYDATCVGPTTLSASRSASPIIVTGLTNGTTYSCSVQAVNAVGSSNVSNAMIVTPTAGTPVLAGVFSRKTHGSAGTFDLPLDRQAAIDGAVTVEPRIIGAGHTIVFKFASVVSLPGTVSATAGAASASVVDDEVRVTLTGIGDRQRTTISLSNIDGTGVNASVSVGFLVGDVNNTRLVDATDAGALKSRAGQTANTGNFVYDLNTSGGITASEVAAVKARSGNALLP